ncbi:MAG TPA: 5'-nucleotidase [Chitinophagales bacterium]|nr:5'-nucleotidase [Chitinophagales bacterium]
MARLSLLLLLFVVSSCSKNFVASSYRFEEKKLTANSAVDSSLLRLIQPYKDSLDKEMGVVLAISDTLLTKAGNPESDLGNLMCDLILKKSADYAEGKIAAGTHIDFTFLNTGGIRLPNLPKGNITLGKIVELMPFENLIDIITVHGSTLDTLFNFLASKGGWPVSGARYKISNGKAVEVFIQGKPLELNKNYTLAVSDYLAQGGDNCTVLIPLPKILLKKSLRDALIDGLKEMNARGEHVKSVLEGRVMKVQ